MIGVASYGQLDAWNERTWAAFGLATLAAWGGIALLSLRRRLTLDRRAGVVDTFRGALRPHFARHESLTHFDRVSLTLEDRATREGSTTTYAVRLEGRDAKVDVDEPGYWEPARNLAEEIAAFLRLPLHDAGRSGKLRPDDLDRTAGRRDRHVNPVAQPRTLRCRVEEETDTLLRVFIPSPDHRPFLGLSVIVGLFFLVVLTIELFLPLLAGRRVDWLGVALPVLIPAWVFYESARAVLTNGGLLEVTPGTFRMTLRRPFGERVVAIPATELEDLVILKPEMGGPRSLLAYFCDAVLVARSDRQSVRLGYGMAREELHWLRARIVSVLGGRDDDAPRPKGHLAARRWDLALIGASVGVLAAHLIEGRLAVCVALPFLQHLVSVGVAAGLAAGLFLRRILPAAGLALLIGLILLVGGRSEADWVQGRPRLAENPRYLRSDQSLKDRRYLSGFLPAAALLNLAAFELTLSAGEWLWRRRKRAAPGSIERNSDRGSRP